MRLLVEQTQRMRDEVRALDALVAELECLNTVQWGMTDTYDVRVNFDFTVKDKVYEAQLVYPSLFPEAPAYVRPRNLDEAWSAHRYPSTGTLCLEWGPDNWHPDVTGADLVRSTIKLLVYEKIGSMIGLQAPSRHNLTVGQRMRGEYSRFLATPEFMSAIAASSQAILPLVTATTCRLATLVTIPTKVGEDADPPLSALPPEIASSDIAFIRKGWVIKVDEWASLPNPAGTPAAVRDFLKAKGLWPQEDDVVDRHWFLALVDAQGQLRPLAFTAGDKASAFEYVVLEPKSDQVARQPDRHSALDQKRVAIVGCGSLGSKLAVSLARSGVTRFYLVDDDVLMPGNVVRHQLDWLSVGHSKVDALKAAILLVRPDAEVQNKVFRFAGQESASLNMSVLEQIAACDLVIDATASPRVFSSIAAICARRKVACVWGEVFAGGIGALMARSLPGMDADPLTVRAAIHGYLADQPEAPFKNAQNYEADAEGEVLVAGDAEVSQLAASMTQFVIDALTGAGDYRFPVPAYLLGFQQAWIFEAPFDTHPIRCPAPAAQTPSPQDVEDDPEALKEVLSKFQAEA